VKGKSAALSSQQRVSPHTTDDFVFIQGSETALQLLQLRPTICDFLPQITCPPSSCATCGTCVVSSLVEPSRYLPAMAAPALSRSVAFADLCLYSTVSQKWNTLTPQGLTYRPTRPDAHLGHSGVLLSGEELHVVAGLTGLSLPGSEHSGPFLVLGRNRQEMRAVSSAFHYFAKVKYLSDGFLAADTPSTAD